MLTRKATPPIKSMEKSIAMSKYIKDNGDIALNIDDKAINDAFETNTHNYITIILEIQGEEQNKCKIKLSEDTNIAQLHKNIQIKMNISEEKQKLLFNTKHIYKRDN
eukprot:142883_1